MTYIIHIDKLLIAKMWLFSDNWKPNRPKDCVSGGNSWYILFAYISAAHLYNTPGSGTPPWWSLHTSGSTRRWHLHMLRTTGILRERIHREIHTSDYTYEPNVKLCFVCGDWPDMVWMGWSRLNLLRITKSAVMGSNKRTAQAILATALQQTTWKEQSDY